MAFEAKKINPLDLQPRKAIGVAIPFSGNAVFNSTYQSIDAIKANLINYLLTGKGERYLRPTFGSGLRSMLFENATVENLEDIEILIREALVNYFPELNIIDLFLENKTEYNTIEFGLKFAIVGTDLEDEILINIV